MAVADLNRCRRVIASPRMSLESVNPLATLCNAARRLRPQALPGGAGESYTQPGSPCCDASSIIFSDGAELARYDILANHSIIFARYESIMTANGAAVPLSAIAGMRKVSIGAALLLISFASGAQEPSSMSLPIFDAHIHYSHDAWQSVPPQEAIAILRKAGVRRALVSSSGDDGQQKLHALAPDLILPSLRPYRSRGDISTWVRDQSVIAYLEERLKRYRYAAIGEFHVYGADADLPVVRRVVELAKQHRIFLHSHSDADAIERHFRQDPDARILWAHSGFDRPERVREMLRKHKNLWCDLAWRTDHAPGAASSTRTGAAAMLEFPTASWSAPTRPRPSAGTTSPSTRGGSRTWLAELPREVAEKIAYRNGEAVFGRMLSSRRSLRALRSRR